MAPATSKTLPPPSDDDPASQVYETVPPSTEADAAVAIPDSGDSGEGGKLKMIVQLVKRCLGVKDIAAMRLSLPASLLEPIPNLEYSHYLDRPDLFAAINDSADPLERMLAVLRWSFSKELKYIRGKICKPYNSVLGEHFRAHWQVKEVTYPTKFPAVPPLIETHLHHAHPQSAGVPERVATPINDSVSLKSAASKKKKPMPSPSETDESDGSGNATPSRTTAHPKTKTGGDANIRAASAEDVSKLAQSLEDMKVEGQEELDDPEDVFEDAEEDEDTEGGVRVVYLTEQISHHPPASSYYAVAVGKGVEAAGVDQISAKVSGTTIRVTAGNMNKGVFISLTSGHGKGEEYHMLLPAAHVNGILRGNFYATVTDSCIITCSGSKTGQHLRAIIEYKDESWIGKPQFLVEGVVHTYDPESPKKEWEAWTKVKHVPSKLVVATLDGCWRKKIEWKRAGDPTVNTLLDIDALSVVPKNVRPLSDQLPNESRKLWEGVTTNLLSKNYGEATKIKQTIEQRQRDIAAVRKTKGEEFVPVFFETDVSSGKPVLSEEGRKAVDVEAKSQPSTPES